MSKSPTALIVGRGPDSARAALDLAQAGVGVILLTADEWLTPGQEGPVSVPSLLEAAQHPQIDLLTGARVETVHQRGPGLRVAVQQSPRYIDSTRCTACGACVDVCPILIPGSNGDAPHKAIYRGGVPTTYAIDKAGTAPCRHACPIDQRAQGYVALVRAGHFQLAYHAIKRENPFPSVCGRVCNHLCETSCTRCEIDEPVAVMAIKRFVTDWAWKQKCAGELVEARERVRIAPHSGYRVAVVGAGPAGLTAARELNRMGHDVTVLEALPVPGGMMRVGIPSFRLPRERLNWDVAEILAEGVALRTNSRVDDVEQLFEAGYDAAVLAVGLHASRQLSIPGAEEPESEWPSVMGAVEFLRQVNLGERPDWRGRRVIVVGGGSTAMDTARFCRRLGAEVTVVYRRSRAEMPAHDFEVEDAEREGVTLRLLTNPTRILRESPDSIKTVECLQMRLGEPDESGRRRPIPVEGSEFTLPADTVLLAIGQTSDLSLLPQDGSTSSPQGGTVTQRRGIVGHDPVTGMTGRPGLFVAGDVAGTEGFVVNAIASGLRVARAVDSYLRDAPCAVEPVCQPVVALTQEQVTERLSWSAPRGSARARTRSVLPETLLGDFEETERGLSKVEAIAEASRCMSCGLCSECLACVEVCPADAIHHDREAQDFEFPADALLWADGALEGCGTALPGVFVATDKNCLADTVDRVLTRLGLERLLPKVQVAAPARWACRAGGLADARLDLDTVLSGTNEHKQIGVFLCRCGGEIERAVDVSAVAARIEGVPDVAWVETIDFACHPQGTQAIRAAMAAHALDGAVLAACSCCALDQICYSCTTQRMRCKERLGVWDGLKGLPLQFVNVREQCAFVHPDAPAAATDKAGDMVAAAVAALSFDHAPLALPAQSPRLPSRAAPGGGRLPGRASEDWSLTGGAAPAVECGARFPITAVIDPVRCRGCEDCMLACGVEAMQVLGQDGARLAQVDVTRCLGCGICMAACSSGAILAGDTSDAQAEAMLTAMGDLGDKTVVFSCNWGAYSAVEAAGVQRLAYDPSVRLVRMMCAGRVHEGLILRAFAQGAARVLVLACGHEGEISQCRYHTGNDQAAHAVTQARQLMGLLGIDPHRLALTEMQPGEGERFVSAVESFIKAAPEVVANG